MSKLFCCCRCGCGCCFNIISIWSDGNLVYSFPYFWFTFGLNSDSVSKYKHHKNMWEYVMFLFTNWSLLYCLLLGKFGLENYQTRQFVFLFTAHLGFILSCIPTFSSNFGMISLDSWTVSLWQSCTWIRHSPQVWILPLFFTHIWDACFSPDSIRASLHTLDFPTQQWWLVCLGLSYFRESHLHVSTS